jgi:hypothetical protein
VAKRVGDRLATINAAINVTTVRALHGTAPSPTEVLELIAGARDAGATEEAYRALVNLVWSSAGYVPVDEVLQTLAAGEAVLENVVRPGGLGGYLPLSLLLVHLLPAGRVDEAEGILAAIDVNDLNATTRMVWLGVLAQLAVRRGDLTRPEPLLSELRAVTIPSGEPQRIIPMACAYLPWAALTERTDELRSVAAQTLDVVGSRWATTITTLPAVRALASAGEFDLLARWSAALAGARSIAGRLATSALVAEGLLARHDGRTEEAVAKLSEAAAMDRSLGYAFDAAAIELDLAATVGAAELLASSEAFFASIGCVNPL